ncbi:MAG: hypothetical protein OEL66_10155 [Desulfobulbaceae bacterium]|nr:hypothetical protein [Desulfobulbaceae bacterium]
MYNRISSAHKMLDYRNTDALANHLAWIPFHFLPGNGGQPAGENPDGTFIKKLVCRPDSHVARDMLRACVNDQNKPYGLHRLGVTMHVYADTFAHQGFAGVNHKINEVSDLASNNKSLDKSFFNKITNFFLSESFPLGHGAALSHPDRPSLAWQYTNGLGESVDRNNTDIFMDATDKMCRAMQCFQAKDREMNLDDMDGIGTADAKKIRSLLKTIKGVSGEERHGKWLEEIKNGAFSFGPEEVVYIAKGENSWKHKAIGQQAATDTGREEFAYKKTFLKSDWKNFHDGLQAHRFDILHDILPKYGISAA